MAIDFDNKGNAYVSQTTRRKSSDLDIRQHRDWMVEELGLQSIEQTEEFHKQKLATALSEENTWLEDFNGDSIRDYRDLMVQSEIIKKIYDSDNDGRADAAFVFADGFNEMLTGVGAGVLHHDGEVFFTAAPNVYRLKDTDGDGDADERQVISHGYGIHIAYAGHDMSGLTVGHDGKIYWSIGDIGVNVLDNSGKRWKYPNQGAVMRCNPDGSDFEVFAHGLRNPQELAFDAYGNLISVDNDGDHPGERERYVHILEGSDTGWRINWQFGKYNQAYDKYKVWMDEGLYLPHFPGQAAYLLPALALAPNGPAGLAYNPGTAMGPGYENYFFGSYFTGNSARSRMTGFRLAPKGASYSVEDEKDIINGINSTGLSFGPDGSLYINDWKESYDKKEAGRIWKLDTKVKNASRSNTKDILASGCSSLATAEVLELLDHADMRVRQLAQFDLVKRKDHASLLNHASTGQNLFGRLHAIWGYGQLMRSDENLGEGILSLLSDSEEHVRAQAAKVIGDAKYADAYDGLIALVNDNSARVQLHAIEAIGKLKKGEVFDLLIDKINSIAETDPHLRHASTYALSKIADQDALRQLSNHESVDVRVAATVALRELGSPAISAFVNDKSDRVLSEAARGINDDFSIPEALPALAASLTANTSKDESYIRRAINANLRVANEASANRLVDYFSNASNDRSLRLDALWAMGFWLAPPVLDRVDNRYRELKPGKQEDVHQAFSRIFSRLDQQRDAEFKSMIIDVAGKLNYKAGEEKILDKFRSLASHESVRIAALGALSKMQSSELSGSINLGLEDKNIEIRKVAQSILDKSDLADDDKVALIEKILDTGQSDEKQSAIKTLSKIKATSAITLLTSLVKNLANLDDAIKLDVIETASSRSSDELTALVQAYESAKPDGDMLARYREALYGGDNKKGRDIFAFNESAQCLRCHKIQGYGSDVGPELDDIASTLSREELLLSLVDPSARIAPGYGNVNFNMNDDSNIVAAILTETDAAYKVKDPTGAEQTIQKSNIKSQENLPSGMFTQTNILSKSEIRDLMSFLVTLKK